MRPHIRWPVYVTIWCFVATVYALKTGSVFIPAMAGVQAVSVWGLYLTSKVDHG